jgi:hypothetical protein
MREDIPLIANAILTRLARGSAAGLEVEAIAALERYPFPGNVRELENILERGLSLAAEPQRISADDLHLTPVADETDSPVPAGEKWPLQDYLDRVERSAINEALEKTRYNRTAAAKLLGITFRAMRYRMERLDQVTFAACLGFAMLIERWYFSSGRRPAAPAVSPSGDRGELRTNKAVHRIGTRVIVRRSRRVPAAANRDDAPAARADPRRVADLFESAPQNRAGAAQSSADISPLA